MRRTVTHHGMVHRLMNDDKPNDGQNRDVDHDGYIADDGDEIQVKTHRYLPVPVGTRDRVVKRVDRAKKENFGTHSQTLRTISQPSSEGQQNFAASPRLQVDIGS